MTGRNPAGSPARGSIRDISWRLCKGTPSASASACGSPRDCEAFRGRRGAGTAARIVREPTSASQPKAPIEATQTTRPTKNGPGDANRPGPTMGVTPITGSAGS